MPIQAEYATNVKETTTTGPYAHTPPERTGREMLKCVFVNSVAV